MKIKITYLCVMTVCVMALLSCGKKELELVAVEEPLSKVSGDEVPRTELSSGMSEREVSGRGSEDAVKKVYIFIHGAVSKPGVYELEEGARLYELVMLAGGYTEEAEESYLNLARELFDGEQIYVPTVEEVAATMSGSQNGVVSAGSGGGAGANSKLVNINTATKEELMTISGIGESRANDIITYRNQHGPFRSIKEIQNVSGIKAGIYEKIKAYITI